MSEMDDMAAFATLVDANSFTLAAQWLNMSTSQLSKRISKLESRSGARLLHRTTRSLSLTSAGAVLLPEARALLAQRNRVRDAMACLSERLVGTVRLTVQVLLGETLFEEIQTGFSVDYPDVHVELDLSDRLRDLHRDGFDLAIRSCMGTHEPLISKPVFALQELTCASPDYLARLGKPLVPDALRGHSCLVSSQRDQRVIWSYHLNQEAFRVNVQGTFSSNDPGMLKRAALAGRGIARLPSCMVYDELADGRLEWVLRDYQTPVSSLFLVHGFERHMPRRAKVMAEFLNTWFDKRRMALAAL